MPGTGIGLFWAGYWTFSGPELGQQRLHRQPAALLGSGEQVGPVTHPAHQAPLWEPKPPEKVGFVQVALRELLVIEILNADQALEPLGPEHRRFTPDRLDVLDVQPTGPLATVPIVRQELEGRPAGFLALLARCFG